MTAFQQQAMADGQLTLLLRDAATGQPLPDAVVEVLLPEELQPAYQTPTQAIVDQQQKEFVDTVTIITMGSTVSFPNSDDILHHVYSFSPAKVFELPLYGSGQNIDYQQLFDVPGVVELGCNIHDWMLGYIYVAETDLAAKSDAQGRVQLSGLPAGEYSLRLWHGRANADDPALRQTVVIADDASTQLQLELELDRDNRLRRAPGPSRARYR